MISNIFNCRNKWSVEGCLPLSWRMCMSTCTLLVYLVEDGEVGEFKDSVETLLEHDGLSSTDGVRAVGLGVADREPWQFGNNLV